MRVYVLTPLTRRAVDQRRAVIQGFDIPWRTIKVLLIGFAPSVLFAALAWLAVGEYAIGVFFAVEAATYWLIESRSRNGLHLRRYQTIVDRQRARLGVFTMCGRPIDMGEPSVRMLVSSSVPTTRRDLSEAVTETMDATRSPLRHAAPKKPKAPAADPWGTLDWPDATAPVGQGATP